MHSGDLMFFAMDDDAANTGGGSVWLGKCGWLAHDSGVGEFWLIAERDVAGLHCCCQHWRETCLDR
jgi:hypothetical protein